jgi:hypothetical protein
LQSSPRRTWTSAGDLGFTLAALNAAQVACRARDVDAMFDEVDLAIVATVALDSEAFAWPELHDLDRAWRICTAAFALRPPHQVVRRLAVVVATRLEAVRRRLVGVAADRQVLAEMETALSGRKEG